MRIVRQLLTETCARRGCRPVGRSLAAWGVEAFSRYAPAVLGQGTSIAAFSALRLTPAHFSLSCDARHERVVRPRSCLDTSRASLTGIEKKTSAAEASRAGLPILVVIEVALAVLLRSAGLLLTIFPRCSGSSDSTPMAC
jgi:hypothetical protein